MDRDQRIIAFFMLEHLEREAVFDSEFREYIVEASNRLYDIFEATDAQPKDPTT